MFAALPGYALSPLKQSQIGRLLPRLRQLHDAVRALLLGQLRRLQAPLQLRVHDLANPSPLGHIERRRHEPLAIKDRLPLPATDEPGAQNPLAVFLESLPGRIPACATEGLAQSHCLWPPLRGYPQLCAHVTATLGTHQGAPAAEGRRSRGNILHGLTCLVVNLQGGPQEGGNERPLPFLLGDSPLCPGAQQCRVHGDSELLPRLLRQEHLRGLPRELCTLGKVVCGQRRLLRWHCRHDFWTDEHGCQEAGLLHQGQRRHGAPTSRHHHLVNLDPKSLTTHLGFEQLVHVIVARRCEYRGVQAEVQARCKSHGTEHPQRVVSEGLTGRQRCPDDSVPQVCQAAASEVLHAPSVEIVEQGVHGEVSPLCIFSWSANSRHRDPAVLRVGFCPQVVYVQVEAVEPEASCGEMLALVWVLLHDPDARHHAPRRTLRHVFGNLQRKLLARHVVHDNVDVVRGLAKQLVADPTPCYAHCGAQTEVAYCLEERMEDLLLQLRQRDWHSSASGAHRQPQRGLVGSPPQGTPWAAYAPGATACEA
mmetsp:Transcript_85315/g.236406  ORF Transcript_85315/g.236406 Transcript_85315/m.236406 type:complete len:536 (-) Transcript_85315:258-1865(-)